jgi:glycosyltransferase involved in cell wall biosynthesis
MNIFFVNSTNKWGGVKSWTLDVARGLEERGHRIAIAGRPGPFIDKASETGLEAVSVSFGPDFNPLLIARFMRMFRDQGTNLVVVNVGKDMRSAGVAAKLLGIPVVHRVGLAGDMLNTWKVRSLHRWVRPRILVPCEQIKAGLLRELAYLTPEEITVILTGKEPAPAPAKSVHSPLRFISTSQLNADKGHADVLQAMAELKKRGHDFVYHIVGTGRIEAELKTLATSLDLDDRTVWHGFRKDVRAQLREADVFILPSRREGLPNTLLEAMAEGLVCVSRDVGGVRECWPEGEPGLLMREDCGSRDFETVLEQLLSEPRERIMELKAFFLGHAASNSLERMTGLLEQFFSDTDSVRACNTDEVRHD